VCLGRGAGFVLIPKLDPAFPPWASILLGLGLGFLFVSAVDGAVDGAASRGHSCPESFSS